MSERKKIEDRLRKKEQEILSLEEKIKASKIYVNALRDILKMLESDDVNDRYESESSLRVGSAVDQARHVILGKSQPVHIDDLLIALGKDPTREAKASLTSSLAAYVRRGEIFTRSAPNTFGLVELGHSSNDEHPSEPPADFGQTAPATDDDFDL